MGKQEPAQPLQQPAPPTVLPDVATVPHPTGPLLPYAPGTSPDASTRQDVPTANPEPSAQEAAPPRQDED